MYFDSLNHRAPVIPAESDSSRAGTQGHMRRRSLAWLLGTGYFAAAKFRHDKR